MIRFTLFLGFCCLTSLTANAQKEIDLKDVFTTGKFYASGGGGAVMMHNGKNYIDVDYNNDLGCYVVLRYDFEMEKPIDTLFKGTMEILKGADIEEVHFSSNEKYLLLKANSERIYRHSNRANYYIYDLKTKAILSVNSGQKVFYADISPKEDKVAFVFENNLYYQDITNAKITAVTSDGEKNKIINGKSDWVYEEELVVVQAFQWSPLGDKIAYYRFDESKVKEVSLPHYDSLYPSLYTYKYPKVGEANSEVTIWVYDVASSSKTKMLINEKNDQYIARIKWTKDNNLLSIQRLNRMQNNLELLFADSKTGAIKTTYTEASSTYIDITDDLYFFKDNSFIISSEREGFNQLFYYSANGKLIRKLTPEKFDVIELIGVDEATKNVWYYAHNPTPLVKNVFCVNLKKGTYKMLQKDMRGQNDISFSSDFSYYFLSSNNMNMPTKYGIYKKDGSLVRLIEENKKLLTTLKDYNLGKKEMIQVPMPDGTMLNGWMLKPANFDPKKKYALMFTIYSGPGSQTVKDGWGGNMDMWYNYLTQHDIIVVDVDNRGTGGRGADFKKCTYKQLGLKESDDLIVAAKYFGTLRYIDAARIGIYGWSFGGYMSSLCLMRGADVFKLATSVAPVTDWRYYDNIYTERYMQTSKENKQGYDTTSVLNYVKNLKGKYLVMHGTFDDNVHPQNTFELIDAMVKQNKKYDSEFYTNKAHGISGGLTRYHLYSRITDFILENL